VLFAIAVLIAFDVILRNSSWGLYPFIEMHLVETNFDEMQFTETQSIECQFGKFKKNLQIKKNMTLLFWFETNQVISCPSTTVFLRIRAAAIWWISKDKQRGSERVVCKLESEKSESVKSHQMAALIREKTVVYMFSNPALVVRSPLVSSSHCCLSSFLLLCSRRFSFLSLVIHPARCLQTKMQIDGTRKKA
jgi:hypothetical protein